MSSKRVEPRSIASQLVLLFTPAAALLLGCGIGILYLIVVRHAFAEDRAVLLDKLSAVRADLEAAGGPGLLQAELRSLNNGERAPYRVRVLDSTGRTVAESPGMEQMLPGKIFPELPTGGVGKIATADYRTQGKLFTLLSSVAEVKDRRFTLQVAQDRTTDEQFEQRFGFLVASVLLGGIFASALIAISVTRRGLRPLAEMTRSLKRVSPEHLHERVPPNEWPRELQPVAIAFDEMLDRLESSFTRLSQFSADLAHELRTPVANIRGEAEVALARMRSTDEYQTVLESSVAECERLSAIIDNLLFLARAEAGEGQVHREEFDARAAVEKIAAYYESVAEDRQIALHCEGEGKVWADPLLFKRALSNLIENALRFTPDGGAITVSVEPTLGATTVVVRDTGSGIAQEHLPHVFDRFYRADPARSTEGTGLGLALVKSIAESHRGTVAIASEVGKGTEVKLLLPQDVNRLPTG